MIGSNCEKPLDLKYFYPAEAGQTNFRKENP
jgi:hypothetical protein